MFPYTPKTHRIFEKSDNRLSAGKKASSVYMTQLVTFCDDVFGIEILRVCFDSQKHWIFGQNAQSSRAYSLGGWRFATKIVQL